MTPTAATAFAAPLFDPAASSKLLIACVAATEYLQSRETHPVTSSASEQISAELYSRAVLGDSAALDWVRAYPKPQVDAAFAEWLDNEWDA